MTKSKSQVLKEEFSKNWIKEWCYLDADGKEMPGSVWSFISKALTSEYKRGREEAFKSSLRADKRYPVFANPSIGSISYRDWLRKQIRKLSTLKPKK
jgi:hypothetical protein